MKWAWVLLPLTACSAPRKVQEEHRERVEHQALIGAEWRDSVRVTFHDVVIMPVDSPKVEVKVARVEVERKSQARMEAAVEETAEAESKSEDTPQPSASPWKWLAAIAIFVSFLNFCRFNKV